MGVNTSAILFYGYTWNEEIKLFEGEWEEIICRKRGIVNPDDFYKEPENSTFKEKQEYADKWAEKHGKEIDNWHQAIENVREEFPCEIGHHCSSDYSMPYICIKESEIIARRGYPKKITDLATNPNWKEKLEKFVKEIGIDVTDKEAAWWMVSYWGY